MPSIQARPNYFKSKLIKKGKEIEFSICGEDTYGIRYNITKKQFLDKMAGKGSCTFYRGQRYTDNGCMWVDVHYDSVNIQINYHDGESTTSNKEVVLDLPSYIQLIEQTVALLK